MKFMYLVTLAVVTPLATGFAVTSNQRQLSSNIHNHQAFIGNAAAPKKTSSSISMNIPAFLGAGVISLGLLTFTGEPSVAVFTPTVVVSTVSIDEIVSDTQSPSALKAAEKKLKEEVKRAEREAKKDAKAALLEKRREAYFDYDAKATADLEARTEEQERKLAAEVQKDKEEEEKLKAAIKKDEELLAQARTKEEKAKLLAEEKRLAAAEKKLERKEKRAEKLERVFLAEEEQEKVTLAKKLKAAKAEEEQFLKVEEEFEKAEAKFEEERDELAEIKKAEDKLMAKLMENKEGASASPKRKR